MERNSKTLLILGKDKISSKFLKENNFSENVIIVLDNSNNLKRVLKLLKTKKISLFFILRSLICELRRKYYPFPKRISSVKNNEQILKLLLKVKPEKVYLFRAGLIINKKVLSLNIPIYNIHCAKIPEFGGLRSIEKAIQKKSFFQSACFYKITSNIDDGEVLKEEPYVIDPQKGYFYNEEIAYKAGIRLLIDVLNT